MITVEEITRRYGDFVAVDEVSFTIAPGEIVGLLGHNGAGKTTIMKMMTGFLEPTSGTITINGLEIGKDRQAIQQEIGYLPENCPVYPEMTVLDYLDYTAALRGLDEVERRPLVIEAINRTGLKEKAAWPISTLSRGYRQRTGVAQAILHKPKFIILDEPTNGLDPTQIQHMRGLIAELAKESTVIISTHILQEVQAVCDRVIILKDGRKVLDTKLKELQAKGRLLVTVDTAGSEVENRLKSVGGVVTVMPVDSGKQAGSGFSHTYALELASNDNRQQVSAGVARAVYDHGWQLYGLQAEARNLETVFAETSVR